MTGTRSRWPWHPKNPLRLTISVLFALVIVAIILPPVLTAHYNQTQLHRIEAESRARVNSETRAAQQRSKDRDAQIIETCTEENGTRETLRAALRSQLANSTLIHVTDPSLQAQIDAATARNRVFLGGLIADLAPRDCAALIRNSKSP